MEVVVDGTPESCLAEVAIHLRDDWPYGGEFYRYPTQFSPGPDRIVLFGEKRYLVNSWAGLALLVFLSLITFLVFTVVYLAYILVLWFLDEAGLIELQRRVQVIATLEDATRTRIEVTSNRTDWQRTVESWVQSELVENRAAAVDPSQLDASQTEASHEPSAPSDIPDQIQKLAALRDLGAITQEEFEGKKADLLDRM